MVRGLLQYWLYILSWCRQKGIKWLHYVSNIKTIVVIGINISSSSVTTRKRTRKVESISILLDRNYGSNQSVIYFSMFSDILIIGGFLTESGISMNLLVYNICNEHSWY